MLSCQHPVHERIQIQLKTRGTIRMEIMMTVNLDSTHYRKKCNENIPFRDQMRLICRLMNRQFQSLLLSSPPAEKQIMNMDKFTYIHVQI